MNWHRFSPPAPKENVLAFGNVIPFQRPSRPRASSAPEHLLRATEASLRATDVYLRLVSFRLDLARHTGNAAGLGQLDGPALLRIAAASDALQSAAENALAQIDRQAASKARQAAEMARGVSYVPGDSA